MKVVFLTPQLPSPPHQGAAMRNLAFIKHVSVEHDVILLSFAPNPISSEAASILRRLCIRLDTIDPPNRGLINRARDLIFSRAPDMARRFASEQFAQRLEMILKRYDPEIVQIEGIELARYIPLIRSHGRARIILDEHNCEYELQQTIAATGQNGALRILPRLYSRIQFRRLMSFEASACRDVDAVTAVSEGDREALERLDHSAKITVAPNGIDHGEYDRIQRDPDTKRPALIFVGTMDFRPNVDAVTWFVDQVWPLLDVPGLRFFIVGRAPTSAVRKLAGERIKVTGAVSDVAPYLTRAAAAIVPLRSGGGSRLKVLEAMAAAVPIVSTSVGMAGIDAKPKTHYLEADSPEDFAAAIRRTIAAPATSAKMAGRARSMVRKRYAWERITPILDAVYASLEANSATGR